MVNIKVISSLIKQGIPECIQVTELGNPDVRMVERYDGLTLTIKSNRLEGTSSITDSKLIPSHEPPIDRRVKRIHVNQHNLLYNKSSLSVGTGLKPLLTMKVGGSVICCDAVRCVHQSWVMYSARPLSCGAHVWVETFGDVIVTNPSKANDY